MSVPNFPSYAIESTLELVGDGWSAPVADSELFREADRDDKVNLRPGLLNLLDIPEEVGQIQGGVFDEYELTLTPNNIAGAVRGRGPEAKLLDAYYRMRYLRAPVKPVLGTADVPSALDIPEKIGQFSARQIAMEAVAFASADLGLSWEVRDYTLLEDFDATGRVVDVLRRLIQPWTLVEPFKADIFCQGNIVIVRQRNPTATPAYSLSLTSLRRQTLTLRKRPSKKVGVVTLRGAEVGDRLTPAFPGFVSGIGSAYVPGEQTERASSETFGADGVLLSLTTTEARYEMPAHILLEQTKVVFANNGAGGMVLTSRETIHNTWTVPSMDSSGPVAQQVQQGQSVTTEAFNEETGILEITQTEETGYAVDGEGFTTGQTTLKKTLNTETRLMEANTLTVKTIRDIGPLLVEQATEVFSYDAEALRWIPTSRETNTSGGHRPGGPGRGLPRKISLATGETTSPGGSTQIELVEQLSSDKDAVDVQYSNVNLLAADLVFIMAQFRAAQSFWEYEAKFAGTFTIWLRRGMYVTFEDVNDEDGTALELPVFLLTEVNLSYDESSPNARAGTSMRAFGWMVPAEV